MDQDKYPETENILKDIFKDALGRYISYDPNNVTVQEISDKVPEKNIDEDTAKQIEYASYRLKKAVESGLIAEVIVSALKEMQKKPNLFISEAIHAGCKEWDV
jgi:hypothetical protein